MKYLKPIAVLLVLLLATYLSFNFWFEQGSTTAGLKLEGNNKEGKEGMTHFLIKEATLRWGAWSVPAQWEKYFSLQLLLPNPFNPGSHAFKLEAEDNDLVFKVTTTKPVRRPEKTK